MIQRRIDGTENFYRPWSHYKAGFGKVAGEYWLGEFVFFSFTEAGFGLVGGEEQVGLMSETFKLTNRNCQFATVQVWKTSYCWS